MPKPRRHWSRASGATATMRETFAETTNRLLDDDLSVVLVLADISASLLRGGGPRHPDRVDQRRDP